MSALLCQSQRARMDENLARQLIRRRIAERRLPQNRAVGIVETSGNGQRCDACEEPINGHERAVVATVSLEWLSVRFHVDCYKLWDAERPGDTKER